MLAIPRLPAREPCSSRG